MTPRLHRTVSWAILLAILAGGGGFLLTELSRRSDRLELERQALAAEVLLARRQAAARDDLRDTLDELSSAQGPDTSPYWMGDSPQAALLDMQERVSTTLRHAGLQIESVSAAIAEETGLTMQVRATGEIAPLQAALFALETTSPRIAVARLRADVIRGPSGAEPRLDLALDLQALHIQQLLGD